MKKEKQIIGVRGIEEGDDTKEIGEITFGKSRPCNKKFVLVDINYDEKTGEKLYECGMIALQHDKEAVINYVIVKALTYASELEKEKCRK